MIRKRTFLTLVVMAVVATLVIVIGAQSRLRGATGVASAAPASLDQPSTIPVAWVAPPGVSQVSPCVPTMGEHWAIPDDFPFGPIYCVHNGRLVCIEYMIAQADFEAGISWNDLTFQYWGRELPIQHADIDYLPEGHEGFKVPHYDLHFYLITHDEDHKITCEKKD